MDSAVLLTMPAMLALAIKVWLLTRRKEIHRNQALLGLFLALSLLNVAEIVLLLQPSWANLMDWLRIYYVGAAGSVASLFLFCVRVCLRQYLYVLVVPVLALAAAIGALFGFSDALISGHDRMAYTVTRIPGEHYWVFQGYALTLFLMSVIVLVWGYRFSKDKTIRRHAFASFIAILPPILVGTLILAVMAMGYSINAVIYLPIAISFTLIMLVLADSSEDMRSILPYVPGTRESQMFYQVKQVVFNQNMGHKEQIKAFKNILSKNLVEEHGSLNQAAKNSDIPLATLRRWLKGE